ncbi:MAG: hypothetical protein PHP89_01720 [Candidatus Omnitrophica bacterium]|jgi:nitrogen regulatory protein PII|nr:hypothetical protein [Candidatus Omnitrophota bacterium]MDD3987339.1 hypothetical protein [Candidatus Omnitrophota bacterium]MDD4981616.1 hypothetical protein [Candidatus Omnitrophota bacterium]MDD5665077.1 hypothetical protein [Candidatus Omnitrophota bacterium]
MKMVMVVYNEALDDEVMGILAEGASKNYTKITGVLGDGVSSGSHLGTDIWPGLNNILYIACKEAQANVMIEKVRELRKSIGHEGVKAFVLPLEEVT